MSVDVLFLPAERPSKKTLLFVGGSGEDKDTYKDFLVVLHGEFPGVNMCAFSYSNDDESSESLVKTIEDLRVVMTYLVEEKTQTSIYLWATSMGAYSTCKLLGSNEFSSMIEKIMFCDPADFPQKNSKVRTWSGFDNYDLEGLVASDWLKTMDLKAKVTVVHFLLKNHGADGYIDSEYGDRGKHHEDGFTRLSTDMVKVFWNKLPEKNKDKYIEDKHIPHAIFRDGNIEENQKRLLKLIVEWLAD